MSSVGMPRSPTLSEAKRSWLSLWLVVHFFVLIVCLVQNNGSSFLVRRLYQLTGPYSTALMQDYGAWPIEMTTGALRSRPHRIQVHKIGAATDQWETVEDSSSQAGLVGDGRWRNFSHMLAVAAAENNEELVYIVFHHLANRRRGMDAIRLLRTATLSYAQTEQYIAGRLPAEDLNDSVLYEARIVLMPDDHIKLLPVLEKTRRATPLANTP